MKQAKQMVKKGYAVWDWACAGDKNNPDIVIACAGDTPTREAVATISLIKKYLPKLNVKFVNVLKIMCLTKQENNRYGLSDKEFDALFTKDKPVLFNFHGYAGLIKSLVYDRANKNFVVNGYREEGTITTSFDMPVRNQIDRLNMMKQIVNMVKVHPATKKKIVAEMDELLNEHNKYIVENGVDMPEISNWKWQ